MTPGAFVAKWRASELKERPAAGGTARPLAQPARMGGLVGRAEGYPKRPVARDEAAAKALKARTLYNARSQWLTDAHTALDAAVAAAYRWGADFSEEEALRELLALNSGAVLREDG